MGDDEEVDVLPMLRFNKESPRAIRLLQSASVSWVVGLSVEPSPAYGSLLLRCETHMSAHTILSSCTPGQQTKKRTPHRNKLRARTR